MAMTSITRSTRRSDGRHRSQPTHLVATHTRSQQNSLQQQHPSSRGTKRPYEPAALDYDAARSKKARITVEILSKKAFQSRHASQAAAPRPPHPSTRQFATNNHHSPPPPPAPPQQQPPKPARSAPPTAAAAASTTTTTAPRHPTAAASNAQSLPVTKHQEKVISSIKHELNRLQPSAADTKEQGRKLRSQEATRFKSELSAYFPDYDEVIGNDPKEQHILNLDTPILIADSTLSSIPALRGPSSAQHLGPRHPPAEYPIRSYGDVLFTDLCDSQKIDFGFLETRYKGKTLDDPLPDSYFEPAHKKAERLERSIRNTEKGRAQHEKDQIIRLLEGLQGPDWLRTMGVSGITESRKKAFEPAREHFIKGCYAILEKFRLWNLEEKRRKLEKERALAEEAKAREDEADDASNEEEDEEEDGGDEDEEVEGQEEEEEEDEEEEEEDEAVEEDEDEPEEADERRPVPEYSAIPDSADESDGDPPDLSDVDASIAKQLHEEVRSRLAAKAAARQEVRPPSPEPYKEFTSFFSKKYQRDAALSKSRRRGRTVLAWGQPVPEPPETDFDLPEEYQDEELLRANARRRRRDKRGLRR